MQRCFVTLTSKHQFFEFLCVIFGQVVYIELLVTASELVGNALHFLHLEVLGSKGLWQQCIDRRLHIGAVRFGHVHVPTCPKLQAQTHTRKIYNAVKRML